MSGLRGTTRAEYIWRSKLKFAALLLRGELLKMGGGPEPCGALLKLATRETPDLLDKIEAVSPSFLRDKWRIFDLFEEYFVFTSRGPAGWEVKLRTLASFEAWEKEYDKAVKDVRDFPELKERPKSKWNIPKPPVPPKPGAWW